MFSWDIICYTITSCWAFIIGFLYIYLLEVLDNRFNIFMIFDKLWLSKDRQKYKIHKYSQYLVKQYLLKKQKFIEETNNDYLVWHTFDLIYQVQMNYFKRNNKKLQYPHIRYNERNFEITVIWNTEFSIINTKIQYDEFKLLYEKIIEKTNELKSLEYLHYKISKNDLGD